MSVIRVIKKFGSMLSRHQKLRIFEISFLMVLGGFLEMCSVSLIVPFMNAIMNPDELMKNKYVMLICNILEISSSNTFLFVLAVFLAAMYVIKNIYLLFEYNIQYKFVYNNMFSMQKRLLDGYLHRPYNFFLKVDSGEIIRIVNNDTPSVFSLLSTLLGLFTEIVVSGMLVITVFLIAPVATLTIAIVMVLLLLCINFFTRPILRKAGNNNLSASSGMNKWLLQSIQGIKELKVMAKEKYFLANYNLYGSSYVESIRKSNIISMVPRFLIEAISMSTMFIIVAFMVYQGASLEIVVPMLSAVAMAAVRLLPSINRIASSLSSIAYGEPALDKLIENIEGNSKYKESVGTADVKGINVDDIRFENVSYRYPESEKVVLKDINFVIHKGECVGIVGPSGAGKTTTVDILLGLLAPLSGKILSGKTNVKGKEKEWMRCIGYIPQQIFMLDDTIRANVAFGVDAADVLEDRVWEALDAASLSEYVRSLPLGLDTQIGERGIRISGGQRQRIGIARALYLNTDLLVFDEATSALDNDTENAIMESINSLRGQKTMIIIAHRLTTLKKCDRIFKVEGGSIVEEKKVVLF